MFPCGLSFFLRKTSGNRQKIEWIYTRKFKNTITLSEQVKLLPKLWVLQCILISNFCYCFCCFLCVFILSIRLL